MNREVDEYILFERQGIDHYVDYFLDGDRKRMKKHMKHFRIRNLMLHFGFSSDPIVVKINDI